MTTMERRFVDISTDIKTSGVAWGSIIAGAAGAAALSLILLILGTGLGFSVVSPWPNSGISASTLGVSSILWLALTQIAASTLGGYLAGRLRLKWAGVHTDEIYFRDTAHGFLAWATAALITAVLIGSVIGHAVTNGASAASSLIPVAEQPTGLVGTALTPNHDTTIDKREGNETNDAMLLYMVDTLFRSPQSTTNVPTGIDNALQVEAARIFAVNIRSNGLPPADRQYLAQMVATHTGLNPPDADKRVTDTFERARLTFANTEQSLRQAAERARKVAAYSSLWMFIALLCGAFSASMAATFGGRQRDRALRAIEGEP